MKRIEHKWNPCTGMDNVSCLLCGCYLWTFFHELTPAAERDCPGLTPEKVEAMIAENERLRAALQLIDDYYQTGGDLMSHVAHIAQNALNEQRVAEE